MNHSKMFVTSHDIAKRNNEQEGRELKRDASPTKVNNVYITSLGSNFFLAQCEGELSKEGR
jgi:hypothetical protein